MARVAIRLVAPLRPFAEGKAMVEVEAGTPTVSGVLLALAQAYPDLGRRLIQENGRLHLGLVIFVNDQDIRFLKGLETAVAEGEALTIVAAQAL